MTGNKTPAGWRDMKDATAPAEIFLQTGGSYADATQGEVTWSETQVDDSDERYIRATGFAPVVTEEMIKALQGELIDYSSSRGAFDDPIDDPDAIRALLAAIPHAKTEAQVEEALLERCAVLLEAYHNDVAADILRAQKGKSDD